MNNRVHRHRLKQLVLQIERSKLPGLKLIAISDLHMLIEKENIGAMCGWNIVKWVPGRMPSITQPIEGV